MAFSRTYDWYFSTCFNGSSYAGALFRGETMFHGARVIGVDASPTIPMKLVQLYLHTDRAHYQIAAFYERNLFIVEKSGVHISYRAELKF